MARMAHVDLVSMSPYSPSRSYRHEVEYLNKETHDAYEMRTWRNKCHTNHEGNVFIPPMGFKMGLDTAAKMLGRQIPGKGKATYSKYFLAGVLCIDGPVLPHTMETVACDRIYANADGVRGSGKRVWRMFPRIDDWQAQVDFTVLADEITSDVFEETLKQAGAFVGVGRFRPEKGGFYGRYKVKEINWSNINL